MQSVQLAALLQQVPTKTCRLSGSQEPTYSSPGCSFSSSAATTPGAAIQVLKSRCGTAQNLSTLRSHPFASQHTRGQSPDAQLIPPGGRGARCISTGAWLKLIMVSRRKERLLQFSSHKARALEKVDLSRKGSVDEAIMPMVKLLNSTDEYYTTSSCSGRISIFCEVVAVMRYCSGFTVVCVCQPFCLPAGQQAAEERMSLVARIT